MRENVLFFRNFPLDRDPVELRNRQYSDILRASAWHPFRANVLFKWAAVGIELLPDDAPHRLFRFNPRTARLAPARSIEHSQFNTHAVRFFEGVVRRLHPFRAQHIDRVFGTFAQRNIADHGPCDADLGHILQIFGDPLFRDIPIQPVPVAPGFSCFRRLLEGGR